MKFIEEFREPKLAQRLIKRICEFSTKRINLMEVCGTHTTVIFRSGIKKLLPDFVNLLSGPGCPVCVTPETEIEKAILLAKRRDFIITTFGDILRVPGATSSLEKERTKGSDIRVVYSCLDALNIARSNPGKMVIFLGVGFETTSPTITATVLQAEEEGVDNFFILSTLKLIPPAMELLLKSREVRIDGFICPGHVSVIIGAKPYRKLAENYQVPCVIAGFEPLDILQSIYLLLLQIKEKRPRVVIQYKRAVKAEGNQKAQKLMKKVFEIKDSHWRGLGMIEKSGLFLRKEYRGFDVEKKFPLKVKRTIRRSGCICGEILRGVKSPSDCPLFGKSCTPENAIGPCMVSSEGSCAAYFKYGR